jgi:hypothetical protein
MSELKPRAGAKEHKFYDQPNLGRKEAQETQKNEPRNLKPRIGTDESH